MPPVLPVYWWGSNWSAQLPVNHPMRATSFHQLFLIKSTSRILYIHTYCGQKIFLQYYPFWRRGHEIIFIFPFFCKLRLYAWSRILLNFASASQSTNRLYDAYIQRVFATRINNIDILRDRNHEYTRRSKKKSYEKKSKQLPKRMRFGDSIHSFKNAKRSFLRIHAVSTS